MEGQHIAFKRARELNAFTGFRIGDGVTEVSHFFYADDAVFLCDWSLENVRRGTTSRLVVVLVRFLSSI
ncbi:hypothetical protein Tco_0081268 [Tanacetum coccineum]